MAKNIILLSDGTGNSNIKGRGTNVFKLYEAIDLNSTNPRQVAFYDDGVGTEDFKPLKLLGGAFGWGLSRNIRQLYKELVQAYEPGDKIYLFGFSRGAFTVRRLATLIAAMGVLDNSRYRDDEELTKAVWHCYKEYRAKNPAILEGVYQPLIKHFFEEGLYKLHEKKLHFHNQKPDIELVGVWDTVAAVGLPFDSLTDFIDKVIFRFKFSDHKMHAGINRGCHALSIDDMRQTFHPLLWENEARIEQVWFPGVHSNVGGGYPQQGLSLVALEWMMNKAEAAGLKIIANDAQFVKDRAYENDKLYDSRSGLGVYYRFKLRDIAAICKEHNMDAAKVHISAIERIAQGVFGYAPGNFPCEFDVVDHNGAHKQAKKIAAAVKTGFEDLSPPSLLEQAASFLKARRVLYYVMLVYSYFTLYWLVRGELADPQVGLFGTLKILVSPDGLLDKIVMLFWEHPLFVVVGVIIFGCSTYVRTQAERSFALFWSKLRPKLKTILDK